jgi:hypothetical protein
MLSWVQQQQQQASPLCQLESYFFFLSSILIQFFFISSLSFFFIFLCVFKLNFYHSAKTMSNLQSIASISWLWQLEVFKSACENIDFLWQKNEINAVARYFSSILLQLKSQRINHQGSRIIICIWFLYYVCNVEMRCEKDEDEEK